MWVVGEGRVEREEKGRDENLRKWDSRVGGRIERKESVILIEGVIMGLAETWSREIPRNPQG